MSSVPSPKIGAAEGIVGYVFNDKGLVWEALQAAGSGVSYLNGHHLLAGNKSLAAVGDAAMTTCLKHYGWKNGQSVGQAASTVTMLTGNGHLARICDEYGLTSCINGNPAQLGHVSPRTKTDTVKAIIGAVYIDGGVGGMQAVEVVMENLGLLPEHAVLALSASDSGAFTWAAPGNAIQPLQRRRRDPSVSSGAIHRLRSNFWEWLFPTCRLSAELKSAFGRDPGSVVEALGRVPGGGR